MHICSYGLCIDHGIFLPQNRVMCLHNEDNGTTEERGHEMQWHLRWLGGPEACLTMCPLGLTVHTLRGNFIQKANVKPGKEE